MSSRVTRSAARLAEESSPTVNHTTAPPPPISSPKTRKRKAQEIDTSPLAAPEPTPKPRRAKRQKLEADVSPPHASKARPRGAKASKSMAKPGPSSGNEPKEKSPAPVVESSKRKSSGRSKKTSQESEIGPPPPAVEKKSKKHKSKKAEDVATPDAQKPPKATLEGGRGQEGEAESSADNDPTGRGPADNGDDPDQDQDPFRSGGFLAGHRGLPMSMSNTLRALSGYVSGVSARLRDILDRLRQKDDPSVQLIALQELSEILLVSNEDNLSGHFSPDQVVRELIALMQPSEAGEENPEMMLLACRCIANLMEALPQSTGNVVYGGAVPILCQKLLEIHFIDLAEQALSTLEKISVEFPSAIVREGGLTACLTYLDFFATSTQRTAVTTAANCCKNIPQDSFPTVRDVMPILLNVLSSSDQKVVEQASICVSRVVESFRYQPDKLEELVSVDLLKAVRRLLQPGTTNLIGPHIHTQFLRVLAITAHSSPKLSAELLKMGISDTMYQILTGVSPPSGVDNVATQIDSVFIMQALIHRPREQITETLNVICDLLPAVQVDNLSFQPEHDDEPMGHHQISRQQPSASTSNAERLKLLNSNLEVLKRFAVVLFPTLTDAYSSTVNLAVRQKVLIAQLKMLSNLDTGILKDALRAVPYASFIASILSQEDHPSLVTAALKAADLLLKRLLDIYGYQFYREGVMAEVAKLADKPLPKEEVKSKPQKDDQKAQVVHPDSVEVPHVAEDMSVEDDEDEDKNIEDNHPPEDEDRDGEDDLDDDDDDADDDGDDGGPRMIHEEDVPSPSSSGSSETSSTRPAYQSDRDFNILRAKAFLNAHENDKSKVMREKSASILKALQTLATNLKQTATNKSRSESKKLFLQLSKHFQGDALETITSAELLQSDVIDTLLQVLGPRVGQDVVKARTEFVEAFLSGDTVPSGIATPFNVFIHKLQDLLSRSEHFEVITIHQNALENVRSSPSSMLSKQIRIRLISENESETPKPLKHQVISIHAIATFKALDDYLRPRIALGDHKSSRTREGISNALAAFAAAAGMPPSRLSERLGVATGEIPSTPPPPSTTNSSAKGSRKALKSRSASDNSGATTKEDKTGKEKDSKDSTGPRRSSRRHHQRSAPTPTETTSSTTEAIQAALECADERPMSDEDAIEEALDAIVDDMDDGMDDEDLPEPTPVNMEIASTGKVTARKEDGTAISTSVVNTPTVSKDLAARRAELLAAAATSASGARDLSYAAAVQSTPQDWHLEFSLNDRPVSSDMTIYRAVQNLEKSSMPELPSRNIWSTTHIVKFKKVKGPPPADSTWQSKQTADSTALEDGIPESLSGNPTTAKILRLLKIFHQVNDNIDAMLDDDNTESLKFNSESVSIFVNTKLTAKLNRQMEEPLIVASNCLPKWTQDLTRLFPFLFPFETRHLFLQSTSFGYARSMTRWQNQSAEDERRSRHRDDRPFQGRLQRQKVRLSRTRILDSASRVMEMYSGSSSVLEVEYFGEVGTGLGPTLEFYSTVSKEFSKKKIKMWREGDSKEEDDFIFDKQGLFPAPMTAEQAESEAGKRTIFNFKLLGRFIARSMLDSRIIDVSFNPVFFGFADPINATLPSLAMAKNVDPGLAKSLQTLKIYVATKAKLETGNRLTGKQKLKALQKIEVNGATVDDLSLDFTLPGYPGIELVPNGANTPVTIENVASFVDKVLDMTLGSGIQKQIESFRAGFSDAFPYTALNAFTPSELVMLFGRVEEDWSIETLLDSIKADHGFNMDSRSVRNLLQVMSELTLPQRRDFLQFVTGSPKLPIGGFKSLNPMFTVVCKPSEPPYTSDDFLISVMTCANYVKLPDYTTLDILRARLLTAIQEGQGAFHLS